MTDQLLEALEVARAHAGRGNITQRRVLWRFCIRAFREWRGLERLTSDLPIMSERRLSRKELAEWIRFAEDFPGAARDVMKLQRQAAAENQKVVLSEIRWSDERRRQLLELHRFALLGANDELLRAQNALEHATQNKGRFGETGLEQRRRMVVCFERTCSQLSEQIQLLRCDAGHSA